MFKITVEIGKLSYNIFKETYEEAVKVKEKELESGAHRISIVDLLLLNHIISNELGLTHQN